MSKIIITNEIGQGDVLRVDGVPLMSDAVGYFHRMVGFNKAKGKVLDIGTGMGHFLRLADRNPAVASMTTVDIDASVQEWEQTTDTKTKPVEYVTAAIEDFIQTPSSKKYDFIFLDYLWGNALMVDEAIVKTKEIIEWAKDNLSKGGQMVLWQEEVRWYNESKAELEKYFTKSVTQDYWNPHSMKGYFETEVWTLK